MREIKLWFGTIKKMFCKRIDAFLLIYWTGEKKRCYPNEQAPFFPSSPERTHTVTHTAYSVL